MAFDLADVLITVSISTGLTALWVMQCLTGNAGVSSRHRVGMLALRLALASLAGAHFWVAYSTAMENRAVADAQGVVVSLTVFAFLCTLPHAIGGRRGVDLLSRH